MVRWIVVYFCGNWLVDGVGMFELFGNFVVWFLWFVVMFEKLFVRYVLLWSFVVWVVIRKVIVSGFGLLF